MPYFSSIVLLVSLAWQSLTFSAPHTWSFIGRVTETHQIFILGQPAQVARVQSTSFDAWVIQRTDSQSRELDEIVLGKAGVGDLVRVSISGPHVSKNGVNWDLCQPVNSTYCRQGALYDTGPLSGDWNMPLSPGNEFIHSGQPSPSMEFALFWNTEILKAVSASKHGSYPRRSGSQPSGVQACIGSAAASSCCLTGGFPGQHRLIPR